MEFKTILVTPKLAKQYLEANTNNRPIKPISIRKYAKDMEEGKWKTGTKEFIKIGTSGRILDGQNRLLAIIRADVSIELEFVFDMDESLFDVLDTGTARTPGDVFTIAGVKNSTRVSAIIGFYSNLCQLTDVINNKLRLTNQGLLSVYKEHPEYWDNISLMAQRNYKAFSQILSPSFIGGFHAYFDKCNKEKSTDFMEQLCTGINVTNKVIALLRSSLISDKLATKRMNVSHKKALIIKTWNYYNKDIVVKKLMYQPNGSKSEKFPIAFTVK